MSNLYFKVDARALLTLGRESIKDHTTALVELVKNSYDADATVVDVEVVASKERSENFVRVSDNGHGMTQSDITDKWLRIGFSAKRKERISRTKRRRTGEKGIGRLSADRLGRRLELRTLADGKSAVGLAVDWNLFEAEGKELTSIPIATLSDASPRVPSHPGQRESNRSGTELKVSGLRQTWTAENLRSLHGELASLTPPFKGAKVDFRINLKNDVVPELNGVVKSSFVGAAELELSAHFDGKDTISYSILDRFDRSKSKPRMVKARVKLHRLFQQVGESKRQKGALVGPCVVQLMFYPRKTATLDGTTFSLHELRQFLDTNAGIRIYRDSIRVKPYGDPTEAEGDWLGLAERKTRSPAGAAREDFRIAPNQLVGAVFVTRDGNPRVKDSSSREGLIHGDSFNHLRKTVLACVFLLEARYHKLFVDARTRERDKRKVQRVRERIKALRSELRVLASGLEKIREDVSPDASDQVQVALEQIGSVLEGITETSKSLDDLAGQTTIYRGLATLGIASAVFGHETQTSISGLLGSIRTVERLLSRVPPRIEDASIEAEKARTFAEKVGSWGRFALLRVKRDKRRLQRIALDTLVRSIVGELQPAMEASSIAMSLDLDQIQTRTFAMDIESALINLLTNAYAACQQTRRTREIHVALKSRKREGQDGFELTVADTGPGVPKGYAEQIWEPLFSTRVDAKGNALGTGLGLTIVRSTVEELGGAAWYERDQRLGGAKFFLWMPVR